MLFRLPVSIVRSPTGCFVLLVDCLQVSLGYLVSYPRSHLTARLVACTSCLAAFVKHPSMQLTFNHSAFATACTHALASQALACKVFDVLFVCCLVICAWSWEEARTKSMWRDSLPLTARLHSGCVFLTAELY
nr:hypothetical protein Iba_chr02dCG1480 [Ipomoea batatas]